MIRALKVILADDHAIVREGLKLLLSTMAGVDVVGEAADAAAVLAQLLANDADLLVLDLGMPGIAGVQFIRDLRGAHAKLRILVLTANVEPRMVTAALEAGADGYLTKHGDAAEIGLAIAAMRDGRPYVSPVTGAASQSLSPIPLTRREREILALIANGTTTPEIAARLGISPLTARKHRENLMRKLNLHNAAELTAYAVRLGLPAG
ncbi:response regulator transcription factor [Devosia neptuniae]|uniref:Response regulator transcription factor n=1 Tax=Devosia neptuniae TaxID=191302 RepID=A0ABY6CI67_9HYPH|nr:response regulator transcription factor [Devosia neptuniae]UXN71932.1 response regulator transcription factor [Devosia neptuniae]